MTTPVPVEPRRLALGAGAAAVIAAVVLVVAVLPAEYGIDPTGLGAATGFARLSESPRGPLLETPAENETRPLYEMRATWRLISVPLAELSGQSTLGQPEKRVTVPLRVSNLTSVTATLRWDDTDLIGGQRTEGDAMEISIRAPGGARSQLSQARNEVGQPGTASATLTLRSVPFPQGNVTTGLTLHGAEDRSGVGNWTFVVRLESAGGVNGSLERDPGQAWTLSVTGEAYEMEVRKAAEIEGDRVRITLAPRQGIEYKFIMMPGAKMRYDWRATGALAYDLHGEEDGKDPDDSVSFDAGTSDGDSGEHVAPFQGRHGWYWANSGREPVTITLTTTGEYSILGVPP